MLLVLGGLLGNSGMKINGSSWIVSEFGTVSITSLGLGMLFIRPYEVRLEMMAVIDLETLTILESD